MSLGSVHGSCPDLILQHDKIQTGLDIQICRAVIDKC